MFHVVYLNTDRKKGSFNVSRHPLTYWKHIYKLVFIYSFNVQFYFLIRSTKSMNKIRRKLLSKYWRRKSTEKKGYFFKETFFLVWFVCRCVYIYIKYIFPRLFQCKTIEGQIILYIDAYTYLIWYCLTRWRARRKRDV